MFFQGNILLVSMRFAWETFQQAESASHGKHFAYAKTLRLFSRKHFAYAKTLRLFWIPVYTGMTGRWIATPISSSRNDRGRNGKA
jgi:hypothetical protein